MYDLIVVLKEVFVIEDGINIFHYSKTDVKDSLDPVLASGFLSAIQSFAQQTRSSKLNSYLSENELVLFDKIGSGSKQLVCIFERHVNETIAKSILNLIKTELLDTSILHSINTDMRDTSDGRKMINRIEQIISLSTSDIQLNLAKSLFNEYSIDFVMIFDLIKMKTIMRKYTSPDFSKKLLLKYLKNVNSSTLEFLQQLKLGEDFHLIIIDGETFHISIFKQADKLTFCCGEQSKDEIIRYPFQINGVSDVDDYLEKFYYLDESWKWKLNKNHDLTIIRGESPSWRGESVCNSLINAFIELLNYIAHDQFIDIQIYIENPKLRQIVISRQYVTQGYEFNFYEK